MDRKEKTNEVFVKLVNQQLLPHGKTYEDVKNDQHWYLRYKTSSEEERAFMQWGVDLLRKELRLSKKLAEAEMSWFVMQWGLTTNQQLKVEDFETPEESTTEKAS